MESIDQLAFRVNLLEGLLQRFTDTERSVTGHHAAEHVITRLREKYFIHKVSSFGKKVYTTGEVQGMHQTWKQDTGVCSLQCDSEFLH
jgi:hypothetical protein